MQSQIRLMSALPIKGAFDEEIGPALNAMGCQVSTEWLPTTLILEKLKANQPCDVVFALTESLDDLIAGGKILSSSRRDVVTSRYGVAVQAGAPHPRIDTLDAFVASLKSARSVAFSQTGASGIYFASVLKKLGLDEEIRRRATIISSGLVAETLLSGAADLAIQQISELMSVPGIEIVGPFPDEVQQQISFSAGVTALTSDIESSRTLVAMLVDPRFRAIYQQYGLTLRF